MIKRVRTMRFSIFSTLLDLLHRRDVLHLVHQDLCCLLTHAMASLLNSSQHGVAGNGTLSIGEATDSDVFGHTVARMLDGVENADGRIIIDGKEAVRRIVDSHDRRRDMLGISTVVAHDDDTLLSTDIPCFSSASL